MYRRKRVNKLAVLYALFAIKIFPAIVAQWTLHKIDSVPLVGVVQLRRQLKIHGCIRAAGGHGRFTTSKRWLLLFLLLLLQLRQWTPVCCLSSADSFIIYLLYISPVYQLSGREFESNSWRIRKRISRVMHSWSHVK